MAKQTLFAYVQGTDLADVVDTLLERFDALVASRSWVSKDVWVVNQQFAGPPVEWDLGLNVALASGKSRPKKWVEDVAAIATALGEMHRDTKRTFVVGIHDEATDTTKDLFVVDTATPDVEKLTAEVGKDASS